MVAPSAKLVVPAGASQTALDAFPLLRIPMLPALRAAAQLAGNT
jgi:hypothetical protein